MVQEEYEGKNVMVMTCSNCNTKCKHCYISYNGNFDGEDLYKLVLELKNKYDVSLNGTEIILHPEYFKTLKLLKQNKIITNGLEIYNNPQVLKKLKENGVNWIAQSYHIGIHDMISAVDSQVIEKNIGTLKKEGFKTEIFTTISRKNYKQIDSICKKALEMEVDYIKFTNYIKMGNAQRMKDDNVLDKECLNDFFEQLNNGRRKYKKEKLYIRRCGTFGNDISKKRKCNFECPAGKDLIIVTPDLKVYPCVFLTKPGYEIGKVENGKIILNSSVINDGCECIAKKINNESEEFKKYFPKKR